MGGSVSLAIAFGEEVEALSAPEDANGFQWVHDEPPGCATPTVPYSGVTFNPNGVEFGNGTKVFRNGQQGQACNAPDTVILRVPQLLFNQNDTISEMRYAFLGTSYTTNPSSAFPISTMDIELKVNGNSIFQVDDYEFRNTRLNAANNRAYNSIDFIHEFDGIEVLKLRSEVGECEPNCNVTITFSDYTELQNHQQFDPAGWFQTGWHRIDTKTTDADTEGLIMTVSPYVVSILTLGLAIGSTRFFNPLVGFIGGRI